MSLNRKNLDLGSLVDEIQGELEQKKEELKNAIMGIKNTTKEHETARLKLKQTYANKENEF